jgi:hypothetical protein
MVPVHTRRRTTALAAIVIILVVEMVSITHRDDAGALYTATASGTATARAATLPLPPAPTITSSGVQALACVVHLSWAAPPAGEQYTILRTNGANTTTVAGPTTTAGTVTDTILVALLLGAPHYTTRATWVANPLWTTTSAQATATGC